MSSIPDLYIQWGYEINAFTVGSENPIVVLNSGLIDMCEDDEIMFIIGHELGHIKSNHMLYHMMANVINMIIDAWDESDPLEKQIRLKELLGHTPLEVTAGALLGTVWAIVAHLLIGLN